MNKITWSIFIAVSVGLFAFVVFLSEGDKIDVSSININEVQLASDLNGQIADNVKGNPDSKIVLIEYGDYQCPACASQSPVTNAVFEEYSNDIKVIFRNYPIVSIHPNAKVAAAAAQAAGLQGKYWEMHDKLYNRQSDWSTALGNSRIDELAKLASELNLDIDKFKSDISSKNILQKIKFDSAIAMKAKIIGTPSFFLNGELLEGKTTGDLEKFKALIAETIEKQKLQQ